jgi:hydrogenase maturation factor HypF (carbamoyltransferase family)
MTTREMLLSEYCTPFYNNCYKNMDFINQAKKLADTVTDKIQEITNNVDDSVVMVVDKMTASVQPGLEVFQNVGKTLSDI